MRFRPKFVQSAAVALIVILLIRFYFLYQYPRPKTPNVVSSTAMPVVIEFLNPVSNPDSSKDLEYQKWHFQSTQKLRLQSMRESAKENRLYELQMLIVPQMTCPTQVRLGGVGDGGKWVCNPWRVPLDKCVVYSLGVSGDVSFEIDLYKMTGPDRCRIYCIDPGEQSERLFEPFHGFFYQTYVGGETNKKKKKTSLRDLMLLFDHKRIDILKIDIEQSEFETLNSFFLNGSIINETQTNVCQLLIELHCWGKVKSGMWVELFEQLERRGFRMFAKEANMYCPSCYEFSYLHLACFEQYGLRKNAIYTKIFD